MSLVERYLRWADRKLDEVARRNGVTREKGHMGAFKGTGPYTEIWAAIVIFDNHESILLWMADLGEGQQVFYPIMAKTEKNLRSVLDQLPLDSVGGEDIVIRRYAPYDFIGWARKDNECDPPR